MNIVYFYQYFGTPKGSWSTRVYEFAKNWVDKGHKVTVVTAVYDKSDIRSSGITKRMNIDGIDVIALNITISNKQSLIKRIWTFIAYCWLSSYYALTLKADVVIASSGPITVGIPGLVAKYLRGRRLIFEVRDLWPQGAIELGILKNNLLKKFAYALEKRCYKAAKKIITLSPGMSEWIKKKYGFTHTVSIPNASNNALFSSDTHAQTLPDWTNKGYVLYSGNIGRVNNSTLLLEAAKMLKERSDIQVVLIGEGQQKTLLKETALKEGVDNFHILDIIPKQELVKWVQNATTSIVPLKSTPILDTSSPNKLFDSLAAATPVIQTTQGWIKDLLLTHKCGYTVAADNPDELVEKIIFLAENKEEAKEMGLNGQRLALEAFDKIILAEKMLTTINEVHAL